MAALDKWTAFKKSAFIQSELHFASHSSLHAHTLMAASRHARQLPDHQDQFRVKCFFDMRTVESGITGGRPAPTAESQPSYSAEELFEMELLVAETVT